MKTIAAYAAACLALAFAGAPARAQVNADLKALIAAAGKEGTLNLSWSQGTLGGSQGAAMIEAGLNKAYGTNIKIKFTPGPEVARIGNQLATEFQAKQPATTDVYLAAAAQIAPLVGFDMFEPVDWVRYLPDRIKPDMTEVGGQFIRLNTGLSGVTYNSAVAPMKPTSLDDFLKPEWKGKIASTPYAASFDVFLADDMWGQAKTVDYVKKLSTQISGLMRCGDAERIATGEFLALVMDCTGQDALIWQERGAPLEQMIPLDAAQERFNYFGVPKNSGSRNAAKLFAVFMMTPEGQKLAYDTWKTDLHQFPDAHIRKTVDAYTAKGVKFKEVTVEWWLKHPEIDQGKSELIKILTSK
jgi:ABC-type Fe3+ transport system substrate-binding protein